MTSLYAKVSPNLRLRASFAALALVSVIVWCAPKAEADVLYSYVSTSQAAGGSSFTIDSPVFLTPSSTTQVPVTTASDLFFFGINSGQIEFVVFPAPNIGAITTSGNSSGLYFPATSSDDYNLGADGVYSDGMGATLRSRACLPSLLFRSRELWCSLLRA